MGTTLDKYTQQLNHTFTSKYQLSHTSTLNQFLLQSLLPQLLLLLQLLLPLQLLELMDMALALPPQLRHTLLPQQLLLQPSLLLLLTILPLRELPLPQLAQPSLPLQLFLMPLPQLLMQQPVLLTVLLCGNLDVTRTQQIKQNIFIDQTLL